MSQEHAMDAIAGFTGCCSCARALRAVAIGSALALVAQIPASAQPQAEGVGRLEASRALVAEFGERLRTALTEAMRADGPIGAIGVCKDVAPQIAAELSRRSGAKISRTSLRVRNPANAPEPWQIGVLNDFAARRADGEEPGSIEDFASPVAEAGVEARYMRAIGTEAACLVCHGEAIAPVIAEQVAADYPHDRATGFALGELRGAFSVVWPR